uniref:Uncharacterized sensor-like histidine kinase ycf26 n=1 Tax=Liagora harveyana TaxID=406718 RepID=A0A1G4NV13_9FLOR|nr:Drug sensory protein A [Liagora harveyana]SCW22510.1 Drug sensory protein A [Liagora harveyana]
MFKDFSKWFNYLDAYTRLLACTTVFISLSVSSIIYWILFSLHRSFMTSQLDLLDTLSQQLGLYIAYIYGLLGEADIRTAIEKIYLSIQDVGYIIVFQSPSKIISILPDTNNISVDSTFLNILGDRCYHYLNWDITHMCISYTPRSHSLLDILIILSFTNADTLYFYIGIKNDILFIFDSSLKYTYGLSLLTFVTIWVISGSTIFINLIMINESVQKFGFAIRKICTGDFSYRMPPQHLSGLIDLGADLNEMAERLEMYEKNNVYQLVLEKSKLETVLSIVSDGIILLDQDLRIVFINPSASKNLTCLKSCIVGSYLSDYLPNYINDQISPLLKQLIDSSADVKIPYDIADYTTYITVYFNNNISKTLQLVMTAVFDINTDMLNGIGISIQDFTDQVGLNEAKTQFISNVSHELRTPLFNIRSFLETLSEYNNSLSEQQKLEFLEIANQETQRLTFLVNDVLDLSRLESDFIDVFEPVEIHEIVPPIIQTSCLRANNKKIRLIFQINPQVLTINGYPNLLTQVLSNLIGNSLKFTPVDGRILLKVYLIKPSTYTGCDKVSRVRIEIIDEGTGIDELDQIRVFDRFVRLENNVHILEGTGLGLSIVKNIVEKHRSQVHLYSELMIGSSFWFDLTLLEKKS